MSAAPVRHLLIAYWTGRSAVFNPVGDGSAAQSGISLRFVAKHRWRDSETDAVNQLFYGNNLDVLCASRSTTQRE